MTLPEQAGRGINEKYFSSSGYAERLYGGFFSRQGQLVLPAVLIHKRHTLNRVLIVVKLLHNLKNILCNRRIDNQFTHMRLTVKADMQH